jgi:hypothetical protein
VFELLLDAGEDVETPGMTYNAARAAMARSSFQEDDE